MYKGTGLILRGRELPCELTAELPFPVAILAGGLATRLRPITQTIPKSLVEVAGQPFIFHQLLLLRQRGVRRVLICAGHLGGMIRDRVGDGTQFGVKVTYSFDGPTALGTAGALVRARDKLAPVFFVLYGDSYLNCDYAAVAAAFIASGKSALMTVYKNSGQYDDSNIVFHNSRIIAYDKKNRTPDMQWIDYGLGVLRITVLEGIPDNEFRDLADVYGDLLNANDLAGFDVGKRFYEIGSFAGLKELQELLTEE